MREYQVENVLRLVGGGLEKKDTKWEDIELKICSGLWEGAWKKRIKNGRISG